MSMKIQTAIKAGIIAALLIVTGCATSSTTIDELNARIDSLASDVASA